ncbi:MAG: hypothetical protein Hals2KO_03910 [Halioglobus sp.]
MTRLLTLLVAILLLSGCRLAIVVTSGGEVASASGDHDCGRRRVCEIEITTDDFNETFTAVPAKGYEFERWQGGPGFNCPGSTVPTCTVTNSGFLALFGEAALTHLQSDKIDHLMPIFKWVGIDTDGDGTPNRFDDDDDNDGMLDDDDPCPLNPDVGCGLGSFLVADGKVWFQPDLFIGETQPSIFAACPGGQCSGVLAGFNMDGWTWASEADMESLFNSYGDLLENDCDAAEAFFNDGWRKTNSVIATSGTMVDLHGFIKVGESDAAFVNGCGASFAPAGLGGVISPAGAWFFQAP